MRWLGLFVCAVISAACTRQPDVDEIRGAITELARAAEPQHCVNVLARIIDDFTGNDGEVDRPQLVNLLRVQLSGRRGIVVGLGTIDIELSGSRATARFDAKLTDSSGRWFPNRGEMLRLVTGWRREHGIWRCYNARWSSDVR